MRATVAVQAVLAATLLAACGEGVVVGGPDGPRPVTTADGEWLVTCHGPAFPASRLEALPHDPGAPDPPPGAEQAMTELINNRRDGEPALAAATEAGELHVLAVGDGVVEFGAILDDRLRTGGHDDHRRQPLLRTWVVERDDGGWSTAPSGDCHAPRPKVRGDTTLASFWAVDEPDPEATEIPVLVVEHACTGGRDIDGLIQEPYIEEAGDQVRVLYGVEPHNPSGPTTCESNPPARTTLELDEALGDRDLVDASQWPPRKATRNKPPHFD